MKLFDPARPRLPNGRPMYPWDRPLAAVPDLVIEFEPEGHTRHLAACLLVGNNTFHWRWARPTDLDEFLENWLNDPEEVMKEHFGWCEPIEWFTLHPRKSSIEDLEIEI